MPTVLVLDGDSGPALAAVRSLGRAGWRVVVGEGTRSQRSRYASVALRLPDALADPERLGARIVGVAQEHGVDVVAPATDASVEVAWSVADALGDTRILGGDRASTELLLDKQRALEAADGHGFPTPRWVAPGSLPEAVAALDVTGLPAVVKSRRSYVMEGGRFRQRRHAFVRTSPELEQVLPLQMEADGSLPIVQAYVPGRSLSATAVLQHGRVVAAAARETLSFEPIAGGTSVWKRTIPPTDVGVQEAFALLRAIGYEGLAEVEYQVGADGVPRLMEIGVRLHGWVALAMHAGVDLPMVAARALLGESLPESADYRVGVEMRWPAGEVLRLRAALASRTSLPPGVSRLDVLAKAWPPWKPGMRYDGVDPADLGPLLGGITRVRARRAAR
jgi:biotin carboxylase